MIDEAVRRSVAPADAEYVEYITSERICKSARLKTLGCFPMIVTAVRLEFRRIASAGSH
jgi:hypothetical protein